MKHNRKNRADNLRHRAEVVEREAESKFNRASEMASVIPFGQPILVGHHSERRDRNYRAKIDRTFEKAFDLHNYSKDLARRAQAAENNNAIYADDDDPVTALDNRIAELELKREAIKKRPHYSYELSNLGANIRRLKKRREQLAALKDSERKETEYGDVTVIEDPDIVRVQIVFPGKPDKDTRDVLKSHGFRWAPSQLAWQRQLNANGRYAASKVIEYLKEQESFDRR